jgi:hypothetical protein
MVFALAGVLLRSGLFMPNAALSRQLIGRGGKVKRVRLSLVPVLR